MKEEFPLVTIITPVYNRAAFVDETVESVLSQDYPNLEYMVLDDGSTDGSRDVLEKYHERLILEAHPNMGETRTVNKGIGMAKGEIICVVNSDDPLLPGAITAAVKTLQGCPDALAAYPDWNEIGSNSELIRSHHLPDYNILNMLTDFNIAIGPGVFIRRGTIEKFGTRDLQFKYVGDLEYWLRLALHGKLVHIPEALATHRTHPEAASTAERGARMADELVRMMHKIYSQYQVPLEIKRIRNHALSQAHYAAVFCCGRDFRALLWHFFMSFWLNPLNTPAILWRYVKAVEEMVKIRVKSYWEHNKTGNSFERMHK